MSEGYAYALGDYHRAVTCANELAQTWFDRAMIWAFGFHHVRKRRRSRLPGLPRAAAVPLPAVCCCDPRTLPAGWLTRWLAPCSLAAGGSDRVL
jgi:hypothetical protein